MSSAFPFFRALRASDTMWTRTLLRPSSSPLGRITSRAHPPRLTKLYNALFTHTSSSTTSRQLNQWRTMHTFVVYAPDKTDEGAVARRFSVRPKHLEGARERHAQGIVSAFLETYFIIQLNKSYLVEQRSEARCSRPSLSPKARRNG